MPEATTRGRRWRRPSSRSPRGGRTRARWPRAPERPRRACSPRPDGIAAPSLQVGSTLVRRLSVLSLHTSPLAQPGTGDGGGMNVYVRELSTALARAGVECDVYTRAWSGNLPATETVEPGLRVHPVPAGPLESVPKEQLPGVVEE